MSRIFKTGVTPITSTGRLGTSTWTTDTDTGTVIVLDLVALATTCGCISCRTLRRRCWWGHQCILSLRVSDIFDLFSRLRRLTVKYSVLLVNRHMIIIRN